MSWSEPNGNAYYFVGQRPAIRGSPVITVMRFKYGRPLTKKDPSLAQLRSFLRTVERGSLPAAAKDLGVTQPTISRQVRELEQAYGASLLVRTTRSLHVTDAGRRVCDLARLVVLHDDALRDQLAGNHAELEGTLRVAAPSGFGSLIVVPFCSRFIERHPKITIDLRLSDVPVDLISEGIDVAVRIGRLSNSSLYAMPLAVLEEVLVSHPRWISSLFERPAELSMLPWTGFSGLQDGGAITFKKSGRKQFFTPKPQLQIDQIVGHREALLAGAGIGVIHRYAIEADVLSGRLVRLLPEWRLPDWPLHAVFPVKQQTERVITWCAELQSELEMVPGWQSIIE